MSNNRSLRAYVRYANNKAVPGSLIVRNKAPKVGTWKEVNYDLCCGGDSGNCCDNEQLVTLSFTPSVSTFDGIQLNFYCNEELISYGRIFAISAVPIDNLIDAVSGLNIAYGTDPDSPSLSPMIGNFSLDGDTITLTMTECKKQTFCPTGELTFTIVSATAP